MMLLSIANVVVVVAVVAVVVVVVVVVPNCCFCLPTLQVLLQGSQTQYAEQLQRLRRLLFEADRLVLAGFTGTPILSETGPCWGWFQTMHDFPMYSLFHPFHDRMSSLVH